nr:hypothetical protein [Endozoicomonas sp.]
MNTLIENGATTQFAIKCFSGLLASVVQSENPDMLKLVFDKSSSDQIEEADKKKEMDGLWEEALSINNRKVFDFILDEVYPLFIGEVDRKEWIENILVVTLECSFLGGEAKTEIIDRIIKKNEDDKELINSVFDDGISLLNLAIEHQVYWAFTVLLDAGVPLNKKDLKGHTPLHHVLKKGLENEDMGCFQLASCLLDRGAKMSDLPENLLGEFVKRLNEPCTGKPPVSKHTREDQSVFEVYTVWKCQDPEAVGKLPVGRMVLELEEELKHRVLALAILFQPFV